MSAKPIAMTGVCMHALPAAHWWSTTTWHMAHMAHGTPNSNKRLLPRIHPCIIRLVCARHSKQAPLEAAAVRSKHALHSTPMHARVHGRRKDSLRKEGPSSSREGKRASERGRTCSASAALFSALLHILAAKKAMHALDCYLPPASWRLASAVLPLRS